MMHYQKQQAVSGSFAHTFKTWQQSQVCEHRTQVFVFHLKEGDSTKALHHPNVRVLWLLPTAASHMLWQ
jgi:hypothetical protein